MTTISVKLPEPLLRQIEDEAENRGVGKSAVIRDCIERTLRRGKNHKKAVTCLDLMEKWVGSLQGPKDLSSNRGYLAGAIAAHADRSRKNSR